MRILKVRRGFTTNSSASSEWIPPPDWKPEDVSPSATPSSSMPLPGPGFTPFTKVLVPMRPDSGSLSGLAKGGGLVAIVATAFVAERVARAFFRRKKGQQDDAE